MEHSTRLTSLDTQSGARQPVERGSGLGQEIRPARVGTALRLVRWKRLVPSRLLQQANLATYRAVGNAELFGCA